ncbi:MAG: hypothetical protein VX278_12495 [Myxococcota bacterium]|nr:hypothetical protein [Myxococcota bacterium]
MTALGAAIFAGLVAIAATVAVERLGGLLGGVLASIPTTIVPAAIGFFLQGEGFEHALMAVPGGMLVNALFLFSWRYFPPRLPRVSLGVRLSCMIGLSLSVWFFAALFFLLLEKIWGGLILSFVMLFILFGFGIWACRNNPPAPKGKNKTGILTLLSRAALAGIAIGISVSLSHLGAIAGIASVFPAIFLTTMVSIWVSQGESVQIGAVGPMMLGSGSVAVYALVALFLFPMFGVVLGAALTWIVSLLLVSLPATLWLQRAQ